MNIIHSITVFCGSSAGSESIFAEKAFALGQKMARENITLIYGGAKVGLMGAVADGCLQSGGKAIGVLPHFLSSKEIAHSHLTELILVSTMHERKTKMHELSDGFIALPGGFGTFEELFEILTWAQLGLHKKPIGLLNINDFYSPLLDMIDNMVAKELLKPINRDMLIVENEMDALFQKMRSYEAPLVPKWIKDGES
jgi:uncharacterized protein (TIGR00730 family)